MTVTIKDAHCTRATTSTIPSNTSMILSQNENHVEMEQIDNPEQLSGIDITEMVNVTNASTTAIRRMHFKCARSYKAVKNTSVPKVIVMGSSTASTTETTINTSTDSASTLVTNVTTTTDETIDSSDLGDNSGQSEPLLSSLDEVPSTGYNLQTRPTDISEEEEESQKLISDESNKPSSITYERLNNGLSAKDNYGSPQTAPISTSVHFPFDPPPSPKSVRTIKQKKSHFKFPNEISNDTDGIEINDNFNAAINSVDLTKTNNTIGQVESGAHPAFLSRENLTKFNQQMQEKDISIASPKKNGGSVSMSPANQDNKKKMSDLLTKTRNHFMNTIRNVSDVKVAGTPTGKSSTGKEREKFGTRMNSAPLITAGVITGNSPKQRNSNYDTTMFPFDREAIDSHQVLKDYFQPNENEDDVKETLTYSYETNCYELGSFRRKSSKTKSYRKYINYSPDRYGSDTVETPKKLRDDYLEQQDYYQMHERRPSKRKNKPDMMQYNKMYDQVMEPDAFMPITNDSQARLKNLNKQNENHYLLSKFDQIVKKFEQATPNKMVSRCNNSYDVYYQKHPSGGAMPTGRSNHMQYQQQQQQPQTTNSNGLSGNQRATSPVPDLRIDFFAESTNDANGPNKALILDECQKTSAAGSINVTSNPMDGAVCTQPRATIVVQQASLSLDNTVETFLLKSEGDYIGLDQGKDPHQLKRREENMRQLLDVTNSLTSEELRDFEMRYGSPHHCRSQSVKTPGSRASGRPNHLSLPQQRSRVASMPNTGVEEEYYRLRHFSITGKGVVNRGDSLKSRRSRSNNSVASSNSSTEHLTANIIGGGGAAGSARTSATCSLASSRESSTSNPGTGSFRVLMLGASAVGKSSLVSQFMTSEYLHAYDTSIDDDSGEKSVSVLLSGEESELIFIDHAYTDMAPENCLSSYEPHGYCIIYSSSDRSSFVLAERILHQLWNSENISQKAVILVGNKADLARCRVVTSEEGKAMATAYDCKFIETSVGINHNVDELLVGLLSQIRLKLENPEKSRDLFRKRSTRKSKKRACSPLGSAAACLTGNNGGTNPNTPNSTNGPTLCTPIDYNTPPGSVQSSPRKYRGSRTSASLKVKGLLGRVWARDSKSKSCENLHVL